MSNIVIASAVYGYPLLLIAGNPRASLWLEFSRGPQWICRSIGARHDELHIRSVHAVIHHSHEHESRHRSKYTPSVPRGELAGVLGIMVCSAEESKIRAGKTAYWILSIVIFGSRFVFP